MGKQAARVLIDTAGHIGPIIAGSPNVWIGGMPAARQGDGFTCSSHGIGSITDGELTVLINGKPAARMGDKTCCATPPDPPIVGSPPKGEHVTAAKNADENGIVHENENSPDWVDIDAKAMYAGYEMSDSNKNGTYDSIKGQVSALDMESHFGNDYVGSTLDLQVLHVKGEARAGWGDGYYGANSSAEAKVAGGTIDAHLGDKDSRIAYAEAEGDLFYAEHELTGEVYTGGEEKKYGLKIRSTEQAAIARGCAGVGTDMLKGEGNFELTDDKGKSIIKDESGIPTEASVGGAVGAVGWDVGLEAYADLDKCNLVAQLDIGLAAVLGIDLHIGGSINYKPLKDFWEWIWGTDEPEVLTGVIITGCPTVLIGKDTSTKPEVITIDNTSEAISHYYSGNGEAVEFGKETQELIKNSEDMNNYRNRIKNGKTPNPSSGKGLTVNMTNESTKTFHIGNTPMEYKTVCNAHTCTTSYTEGNGDGFRDPVDVGIELPGGTPYDYVPYTWEETYPNPGYTFDENGIPDPIPEKIELVESKEKESSSYRSSSSYRR